LWIRLSVALALRCALQGRCSSFPFAAVREGKALLARGRKVQEKACTDLLLAAEALN